MITVVEWVSDEVVEDKDHVLSWLGGWFNLPESGHRWKDYLENFKDEVHPYLEAVRKEILERGLCVTGKDHSSSEDGVPKFSDGKYLCLSWRAWGDLMAAIYSEKEDRDYSYMDFYI